MKLGKKSTNENGGSIVWYLYKVDLFLFCHDCLIVAPRAWSHLWWEGIPKCDFLHMNNLFIWNMNNGGKGNNLAMINGYTWNFVSYKHPKLSIALWNGREILTVRVTICCFMRLICGIIYESRAFTDIISIYAT